jgi:hypothetical protein
VTEQKLCTFEREMLRRIDGLIRDKGGWHLRWNSESCNLYKDLKIVDGIKEDWDERVM